MSEIGLMSPPRSIVYCRGCGKGFARGKAAQEHKPNCIKCSKCGHSVVERIAGCDCCEWKP